MSIVSFLFLPLTACETPAVDPLKAPAAPALAESRPGRAVGFAKNGVCPSHPGWASCLLFDAQRDEAVGCEGGAERPDVFREQASLLPPGLQDFCLYQWKDAEIPADQVAEAEAALHGDAELVEGSVSPLANTSTDLRNFYVGLEDSILGKVTSTSASKTVWLSILDTSPTGATPSLTNTTNSTHGFVLLGTAWRSVCTGTIGNDSCLVNLRSRLALPQMRNGGSIVTDTTNGGQFGTIDQLANAVYAETTAWSAASGSPALVMNLSVGWDPAQAGSDTLSGSLSSASAEVLAAYTALRNAQCRGAVILAASGNNLGDCEMGSGCNGPVLPAAWQGRAMAIPGYASCAELTGGSYNPDATQPLLYAVSGATPTGEPIAISRPGSRALFQAYAQNVAWPGTDSVSLSGTSVATAIASTSAATALARDLATPAMVMPYLHGLSGAPHSGTAATSLSVPASGSSNNWGSYSMSNDSVMVDACRWLPNASSLCSTATAPSALSPEGGTPPASQGTNGNCSWHYVFPEGVSGTPTGNPVSDTCTPTLPASGTANTQVYPEPGSMPCPICPLIKDTNGGTLYLNYMTPPTGASLVEADVSAMVDGNLHVYSYVLQPGGSNYHIPMPAGVSGSAATLRTVIQPPNGGTRYTVASEIPV